MYALLIAAVIAITYLSLINPFQARSFDAPPSAFNQQFDSYSDGHGQNMARFIAGVQNMVSIYMLDRDNPGPDGVLGNGDDLPDPFPEVMAEFADAANPAVGYWTLDWADMQAFLEASNYATTANLGGAAGSRHRRFFPPGYAPSGPWRVTIIQQLDAAGVGTGRIAAVVGYVLPGLAADPMPDISIPYFVGGLRRAFGGSSNIGMNIGGELQSRGVEYMNQTIQYNIEQTAPAAPDPLTADDFSVIDGIPALDRAGNALVPNNVPVYVQCRSPDDPGGDGIWETGDDNADGFCDG